MRSPRERSTPNRSRSRAYFLRAGELVGHEDLVLDRHRPVEVVDRRRDQRGRRLADAVDLAPGSARRSPAPPHATISGRRGASILMARLPQARLARRARTPRGPPRRRAAPASTRARGRSAPRRLRLVRRRRRGREHAAEQERPQVVVGAPAGDAADRAPPSPPGPSGSSPAATRRRAPRRWRRCASPSAPRAAADEVGRHEAARPRLGVRALDEVVGVAGGPGQDVGGRPAVGVHHRGGARRATRAAGRAPPRSAPGRGSGRPRPRRSRRAAAPRRRASSTWLKTAAAALREALAVEDLDRRPLGGGRLDQDAAGDPDPHAADARRGGPGTARARAGGRARAARPARRAGRPAGGRERVTVTRSKLGQALMRGAVAVVDADVLADGRPSGRAACSPARGRGSRWPVVHSRQFSQVSSTML